MTDGRPEPQEHGPQLRARVPDHVADGAFSTGAIVVTGPHEFIIDFLQTIGRPHRVAARVIVPHAVMPQFIEALATNLKLYRERFGAPPVPPGLGGPATAVGATGVPQVAPAPRPAAPPPAAMGSTQFVTGAGGQAPGGTATGPPSGSAPEAPAAPAGGSLSGPVPEPAAAPDPGGVVGHSEPAAGPAPQPHGSQQHGPQSHGPPPPRRPTPQEIYDDLKIPDTALSGAYATGVMIGHGASEFGLDFLTSFYPQSAVSARVFMGAGQIPRLLDSLQHALRQLQIQRNPPDRGQNPT